MMQQTQRPPRVSSVVVGGGLCGLSTALHLALGGRDVVVLEAAPAVGGPGQASSVNCGIAHDAACAAGSELHQQLLARSLDGFRRLEEEDGFDVERRVCGELAVALTEEEADVGRAAVEVLRGAGVSEDHARWLDAEQLHALEPACSREACRGAVHYPQSVSVHPAKVVAALVEKCKRAGVRVVTGARVVAVCWANPAPKESRRPRTGTDGDGAVSADDSAAKDAGGSAGRQGKSSKPKMLVATASGSRFACDEVVLAAGHGSTWLARQLALWVPVIPTRGTMWSTAPMRPTVRSIVCGLTSVVGFARCNASRPAGMPPNVTHYAEDAPAGSDARTCHHVYMKQTPDGRVIAGGDRRVALHTVGDAPVLSPAAPDSDTVRGNKDHIATIFPVLKDAPLERCWTGLMPFTADGVPIIGRLPVRYPGYEALDQVFIVTGLASGGLARGFGAGQLLAQAMLGDAAAFDVLKPADPRRPGCCEQLPMTSKL